MVQKIPMRLVEAGMVLAKPVQRGDGMVLIGEGVKLSCELVERVRSAGVSSITVKGKPLKMEGEQDPLVRISSRLDHLFRKYKEDPLMWTIHNMIAQYFVRKIEEERLAATAELLAEENSEEAEG